MTSGELSVKVLCSKNESFCYKIEIVTAENVIFKIFPNNQNGCHGNANNKKT